MESMAEHASLYFPLIVMPSYYFNWHSVGLF